MRRQQTFVSYGTINSYNKLLNNLNDEEFNEAACSYDPSNII